MKMKNLHYLFLLLLTHATYAQTFDFSCPNNDCRCDISSASGFLATPGELFDLEASNNLSINYYGNFTGSIYSTGNEAYSAAYTSTGAPVIVGDAVYDRNGNYIPAGRYTRDHTEYNPDGSTNRLAIITYVIGNNGQVLTVNRCISKDFSIDNVEFYDGPSPQFGTRPLNSRYPIVMRDVDGIIHVDGSATATPTNSVASVTLSPGNYIITEVVSDDCQDAAKRITVQDCGTLSASELTFTFDTNRPWSYSSCSGETPVGRFTATQQGATQARLTNLTRNQEMSIYGLNQNGPGSYQVWVFNRRRLSCHVTTNFFPGERVGVRFERTSNCAPLIEEREVLTPLYPNSTRTDYNNGHATLNGVRLVPGETDIYVDVTISLDFGTAYFGTMTLYNHSTGEIVARGVTQNITINAGGAANTTNFRLRPVNNRPFVQQQGHVYSVSIGAQGTSSFRYYFRGGEL